MAPDVVLEIDHINPVVNGGDNDIMNLVTSCFDCNRGKGKKKLTEKDEIKKQQEQLKELNEKREQLKMMLEWKEELNNFEDEQVDKCEELIFDFHNELTEIGRSNFKKWIKKYGFMEVFETFEVSLNQYVKFNKDGNVDSATVSKAIDYVPKIINSKGILRNRGMLYSEKRLYIFLNEVCADEVEYEMIKDIACCCKNWTMFWVEINEIWEGDW